MIGGTSYNSSSISGLPLTKDLPRRMYSNAKKNLIAVNDTLRNAFVQEETT